MLALGMMVGGAAVYRATIVLNGAQWIRSVELPQIPSGAPVILHLTVASGVTRQSTSTDYGALHIDGLHDGSIVHLTNNGFLYGMGGAGGSGGAVVHGNAGGAGGPAVRAAFNGQLIIVNTLRMWGGGGGGGGGGACGLWSAVDVAYDVDLGGGGGGGGVGVGAGGSATAPAAAGDAGTAAAAGTGGQGGDTSGGDGGTGGHWGTAGSAGGNGVRHGLGGPSNGAVWGSGGAGGAAGYAVKHDPGTTLVWLSGSAGPYIAGSVGT